MAPTRTEPTIIEPEVTAMAAQLRLSATRLARQLRQQAETELTPSQLSALAAISCHGPLTLGALASHERVAPPSITKVVAKLENQGLISREIDPDDRRIGHVMTTSTGEALLDESRRRKNAWLAAQLRELSDDDRHRLADALDILDRLTTRATP